ncbi:MAG: chorismate synthase, partial [Oscillospiraceae bacterium]|nr:chorismate synthase [Oscillospiraceae bacterium]
MRNTFGTRLTVTLFGESHGAEIGCVLDGLRPGLPVDAARISDLLARRRPDGPTATARVEPDPFRIVSGVYQGRTTGAPLCILIPNTQARSGDYRDLADPRGGGHLSGRLTAPLVAAAGVVLPALEAGGIRIGTHLARCGGVE